MRPTFKVITEILRSHPNARAAELDSGFTTEQIAAMLLQEMDAAPNQRARDAMFSAAMGYVGIYTAGVDDFDRGTEEHLRSMGHRDATDRRALELSAQSRHSPQFVSAERIAYLRDKGAQSSLQQGLSDRLRSRDREFTRHNPTTGEVAPHLRASADDDRDRRAALAAAIATGSRERGINRIDGEFTSLRDTVSAAFDAEDEWQSQQDPLQSDRLANLSDAV